jgi:hypothetical protein
VTFAAPPPTELEVELHADTSAEKVEEARLNKARYEAFLRGSKERAETLPREDIRAKAFGVTNLMLSNLLTGRIVPRNAKEAADVAKIAYELGRREVGDEDLSIQIVTPEARARAKAEVAELLVNVRARAIEAGHLAPDGAPVEDAEVVDVEEVRRGEEAGLPRRSATPGPALARVPRV